MKLQQWVNLLVVVAPLFVASGATAAGSTFCGLFRIESATNKLNSVELSVGGTTVQIHPDGTVTGFPTGSGFYKRTAGGKVNLLVFPTTPREYVTIDYTPYQLRVISRELVPGRITGTVLFSYNSTGQNNREARIPIRYLNGSPNNSIIPTNRRNRTRMENGCMVAIFEG